MTREACFCAFVITGALTCSETSVEDTDTSLEEIEVNFGAEVRGLVAEVNQSHATRDTFASPGRLPGN